MKTKLIRFSAVILCLAILCLSLVLASTVQAKQKIEDRLLYTRESIAREVTYKLNRLPSSYDQFTQMLEDDRNTPLGIDAWHKEIQGELSFFTDTFLGEENSGEVDDGEIDAFQILSSYRNLLDVLEITGSTKELENLFQKIQPYYELLFRWESAESPSADAATLRERLVSIHEKSSKEDPSSPRMTTLLSQEATDLYSKAREQEEAAK